MNHPWRNLFKRELNTNNLDIDQLEKLIKKAADNVIQKTNSNPESMVYLRNDFERHLRDQFDADLELRKKEAKLLNSLKKIEDRLQFLFNQSQLRYDDDAAKLHKNKTDAT